MSRKNHVDRVGRVGLGSSASAATLTEYTPGTTAVTTAAADNVQDAIIANDAAIVAVAAAGGVEGLHLVVAQVGTLGEDSLKFTMAIFDSDDAAVLESLPICVDWLFDDFGSGVYAPMVEDAQYKNDASTVTSGAKYINAVGNGACVNMA